jgi:von Willebrand factor type A domain
VLNNKTAIDALLTAHRPDPRANTPTAAAIGLAVDDFTAHPAPQGSPPVIVLATDGLPNNCGGNGGQQAQTDTINAAANANSKGIRLFLLSVGNKIDATFAQMVANAGQGVQPGQPDAKPFTALDPAGLSSAFQEIIRGVVSCDLKLNGQVDPTSGQSGSVVLNSVPLTYGADWTLDPDGVTIHLIGNACNTLKASANPVVDATFACGAVIF